jgi:hypothetical protein
MDFGVTVFASLGGGHFDDLARAVLDAHKAVLPQGRALHGVRSGGTGIGALEGMLMLRCELDVRALRWWVSTMMPGRTFAKANNPEESKVGHTRTSGQKNVPARR